MIIEPLARQKRDGFRCGNQVLDEWLHKYARQNESRDFSRTYLAVDGDEVLGYVAISAGSIDRRLAPADIGRSAPEFVPVVIITRLAVDTRAQGTGLGKRLLAHAFEKALGVSTVIGAGGVLVSAADESAKSFYLNVTRFIELDMRSSWLFVPMSSLRREFALALNE